MTKLKKLFPALILVAAITLVLPRVVSLINSELSFIKNVEAATTYCEVAIGDACCNVDVTYHPVSSYNGLFCGSESNCFVPVYSLSCYDPNSGGGGGGGDNFGEAAISVVVFGLEDHTDSQWVINPGSLYGAGSNTVAVFPQGGTTYNIQSLGPSECDVVITNSQGTGSQMTLFQADSEEFYLQYTCPQQPTPSVDIKANGSNGPVTISTGQSATLSWTSVDVNSCTASGSWSGSKAISGSQSTGALSNGSYTYTITCTDGSQNAVDSVTVNVGNPPPTPTVDLKVNGSDGPVSLSSGQSGTLSWTSSNVTSCTASGSWSGSKATSGSQSTGTLSTVGSYTYTITCTDGSQNAVDSVTINVSASSVPTVDLKGNGSDGPVYISSGQSVTFSWTSTNATSCTASDAWSGSKATSGSQVVGPITSNATYTITCSGPGGTSSPDSVWVYVSGGPNPTVDIKADGSDGPVSISSGQASTLSWTSTNATSCTASGSWSGSKVTSGNQSTGSLSNGSYTYTITCTNGSGNAVDSVTVNVGSGSAPIVTLSASPTTIGSGQSSTLTWVTSNSPTNCYASSNPSNPQWGPITKPNPSGGNKTITNLTQTTTFSVYCTNGNGSGPTSNATVTVSTGVVTNLSANPTSIVNGGTTVLTWAPVNAATCNASVWPPTTPGGQWSATKSVSGGNQTITGLYQNGATDFTLQCWNSDYSQTDIDVVRVTSAPSSASLSVTSNNSSASWTISPGGLAGSGISQNYTVSPSSGGTIYTISPNSISGYTSSVSSTINGSGGGGSSITLYPNDSASFDITYTPTGPTFDYSMSNSGHTYVTKGSNPTYGTNSIGLSLAQGTTQPVTLSASISGSPAGISTSISNNPCNPTCSPSPVITFTVQPSASAGTYPVTVTGSSGIPNKTTNFNLVVSNPPSLGGSFSVNPTSAPVGQPIIWSCVPSGGIPPYSYSWSGTDFPSPAPSSGTVNITYQTVGQKTAQATITDSSTPVPQTAICGPGSVLININPIFEEF